jgi:hypothetical protein
MGVSGITLLITDTITDTTPNHLSYEERNYGDVTTVTAVTGY